MGAKWSGVGVGLAVATALWTTAGEAQQAAIEFRGGLNVPTFDITDAAKAGPSGGFGLAVKTGDRWWLMADADFGFHPGADLGSGGSGPDVNVYHYIGKLGYTAVQRPGGRFTLVLNAGGGAMTFDVDGGPRYTYPAINVGAKLIFGLGGRASFVISPQGDIAFSKKSELGSTTAWVWPFAVGLRIGL